MWRQLDPPKCWYCSTGLIGVTSHKIPVLVSKACTPNCKNRLLASSCLTVRPSVRVEQLCSQWKDFHEILYFSVFRKYVTKIQFSLNSGKNNGYFTWRLIYIFDNMSLTSSLNGEIFRAKVVENIKAQILCSINLFFLFFGWKNRAVYELMWENIVDRGRPQIKIWRMRIACWITKATNRH